MNQIADTALLGIGATMVMDLWGIARQPLLGAPRPDYAMVGRWAGHMSHGQLRHAPIAASPPIQSERALGWVVHYMTGMVFAAVLVAVGGDKWLQRPTLSLAMAVGVGSVLAPFLIMQPAMGAGIASSRAKKPGAARLQSLLTHAWFGAGLFVAGWGLKLLRDQLHH